MLLFLDDLVDAGGNIPLCVLFQPADAAVQLGEALGHDIRQILLVQVIGGVDGLVVDAHHLGGPTAVQLAGRLRSTTLPAPMRALSPIYTGPNTLVPAPISTLFPRVGWRLPVSLPVPPSVTPW